MEPKLPAPNFGPERSSAGYGPSVEHAPLPPTPETGRERAPEQVEQRGESVGAAEQSAPILPPPIVVPQPPVPAADDSIRSTVSDDGNPLVANDDDLIEKEWVDKAKKIIVETRDDPYRREQEVGKLQADYLRKRYGRELGASQ